MASITCYIYRCSAKIDMYLYLAEENNFNSLPDALKKNIGTTQLAMTLELNKDKKLAKENSAQVMDNLQQKGFHLQMPSDTPVSEMLEKIALDQQNKF